MTLQTFDRIDLGIAVDFEGGLIVPVIRDAAKREPSILRAELNRLKTAARARPLPQYLLLGHPRIHARSHHHQQRNGKDQGRKIVTETVGALPTVQHEGAKAVDLIGERVQR